jgi:chaperone required for assembly of F1-ATPase
MRDILSDLESGPAPSHEDRPRRTRNQAQQALPRRFYKHVSVAEAGDGHFSVHLDDKPALTPGRNPLALPTSAAASLVAAEFEAQAEVLNPVAMPTIRLVNTAIDGVASDPQAVLEDILRYAASDLLCYRADAPQTLVRRQADAWDPILDWARSKLGARFVLSEGVMHVEQPRETIAVLGVHLGQRAEPFRLACLHVMTTLMGSALLALAVESEALSVEDAWAAANIDEDWNVEQWGEDAEAAARRANRKREMTAAANLVAALRA